MDSTQGLTNEKMNGSETTDSKRNSFLAINHPSDFAVKSASPTLTQLSTPRAAPAMFDKPKLHSAFAAALGAKPALLSPSQGKARAEIKSPHRRDRTSMSQLERPASSSKQVTPAKMEETTENLNQIRNTSSVSREYAASQVHSLTPQAVPAKAKPSTIKRSATQQRAEPTYVLPNGDIVHSGKGLGRGRPGIKRGPRKPKRASASVGTTGTPLKRKRAFVDSDFEKDVKLPSTPVSHHHHHSDEEYSPQATHTRSGRHTQRPTAFVPSDSPLQKKPRIHAPTVPRRRKVGKRKERSALCEHCSRGYGPSGNAIVFCDGCNRCWHQRCHDPMISHKLVSDSKADWFCHKCVAGPTTTAKRKQRTSQDVAGSKYEREEATVRARSEYFQKLPKSKLVELLLQAEKASPDLIRTLMSDEPHPKVAFHPNESAARASKGHTLDETDQRTRMHPSSNGSLQTNDNTPSGKVSKYVENDSDDDDDEEEEELEADEDEDLEDEDQDEDDVVSTTDHAALYPKPGNGVKLPPESEDLHMLLEDKGCKTFSHSVRKSLGATSIAIAA